LAEREAHEAALSELETALEVVGVPPATRTEPDDDANSGADSDANSGADSGAEAGAEVEAWAPPPLRVAAAAKVFGKAVSDAPARGGASGEDLEQRARFDGDGDSGGDADPLPEVGGIPIQLPALELLDAPIHAYEDPAAQQREVRARIAKIDETLANFRLQGRVVASVRGPTVTRFEVEPAPGEKISRFSNLSDDLALAMAVGSVRIEAPIPGKSVIGLEVPNAHRDLIRFREAAEAPTFRRSRARLPLILGKSIDGEMLVGDLARMPHLLIAGSTGSGKSVAVNTLVGSLLYKFLPTELRFLMIDPKMVELTPFDGIPHLLRPVVTNPNDAAGVLLGAVAHMERRYKMMSKLGAKNLDQYNAKARNLDLPELPFIVIIIDELADLMITSPKEVESAIMRLAQMARATGMHLILATQRPSVDILTSLIKVNVPARIAFAVSSGHDSRTILDTMGAERLTGMGDMLFYQPGLAKPVRLQGPFISEDEIFTVASFLRRQLFDDDFVEAYGADFDPPPSDESTASGLVDWNDDKLREAAELVVTEGQASVSRLQRRLSVGHARAGKLMDSLEALGVVGAHVGSKPREVLVELHELPDIFGK
jgi:S-DNA-T family DNA segregation ATPase FtsK/SpoIIIE